MPAIRYSKRSSAKKTKARSNRLTNADFLIQALLDDSVQAGGSFTRDEMVQSVKMNGLELDSPRGKRCASCVTRLLINFQTRGLIEEDPDSLDESEVKYRLTQKGLRKFRKALDELEQPGVFASVREKIRFAQDLRQAIFPPAEPLIGQLYNKMEKLERRIPQSCMIDTDDESEDMDIEEDEAENADTTLVEDNDLPNAPPIASTSRLTLDDRATPPPPHLSAHGSFNEQHLLSPPFSDEDDHESQFTPTPKSLYTPPDYPVVDMFAMPGSYGSVAGDNDNNDDMGEGDITMVEPQIDLTAVNDKLAGFKASEFELDYVDQGIGTESPTYSDVEIDATSPSRPLALLFGVKYAMARRAVEQRDEQIAVQKQALDDADDVLKGLAIENAELREHVSDQEDIIGNLEAQRDADAERHQVELAQKDELLTDALEGQAVVQAELKHKTGVFEIMRPKYDVLKDLVKGLRSGFGKYFEARAGVAEILDEDENIYN